MIRGLLQTDASLQDPGTVHALDGEWGRSQSLLLTACEPLANEHHLTFVGCKPDPIAEIPLRTDWELHRSGLGEPGDVCLSCMSFVTSIFVVFAGPDSAAFSLPQSKSSTPQRALTSFRNVQGCSLTASRSPHVPTRALLCARQTHTAGSRVRFDQCRDCSPTTSHSRYLASIINISSPIKITVFA